MIVLLKSKCQKTIIINLAKAIRLNKKKIKSEVCSNKYLEVQCHTKTNAKKVIDYYKDFEKCFID